MNEILVLPFSLPETLKYGIIGLGGIMGMLAFYLLSNEQKKNEPNSDMIRAIFVFMAFSIILVVLGLLSESFKEQSNLTQEVDLKSGFEKGALEGTFTADGFDIDLPQENFKTPRHRYRGEFEIKEQGNELIIEGNMKTYDAKTDTLKGKGKAIFKCVATINQNYMAGRYFFGDKKMNGFGTALIKFFNTGNDAKMYCLFRTTIGPPDIGIAQVMLKRKEN